MQRSGLLRRPKLLDSAPILKADYADLTDELSPPDELTNQAELDTYVVKLETEIRVSENKDVAEVLIAG
jgi:hypothetical protein